MKNYIHFLKFVFRYRISDAMKAQSSIRFLMPLLWMAMLLLEPVPGQKIYYNDWNATKILLIDAKFKNCCANIRQSATYSNCQMCLDDGANSSNNQTDISWKLMPVWSGSRGCEDHKHAKVECSRKPKTTHFKDS